MFHNSGGIMLPAPSCAERHIPRASKGHCTAYAVLGRGPGVRTDSESWTELCNQLILNAMLCVVNLREQVKFHFGDDDEHEHIFDVVASLRDGRVIAYTVKPEIGLESGRFLDEMGVVSWWVRKRNFADDVRLVSEDDFDEVDLHNARIAAAVREVEADALASATRIVRTLTGARALRDLTSELGLGAPGYRALLHLIRTGKLRTARHEKITPNTLVTLNGVLQ